MIMRLIVIFIALLLNGCAHNMWNFSMRGDVKVDVGANKDKKIQPQHLTAPPQNIVLMLPFKGKGELAQTSKAIQNGFLTARDVNRIKPNIKIVDTTGGDVVALYQEAIANNANLVVGPLTKNELEALSNMGQLPVPTIALNTLDNYQYKVVGNLYQFGLLPQDEVLQVAFKMIQDQHLNVAVIAPDNVWGDKIAEIFMRQYEASGGKVTADLRYHFGKDLAGEICNFLAYDATKLCATQRSREKKNKSAAEIMRRQDIDAIFFVVAKPEQARQIAPLLKFYYASDLPLYSISTVYGGMSQLNLDQDINDVYFCDMPWVVKNPNTLNSNLQAIYNKIVKTSAWSSSFAKYNKFYALGIDAYNLAVELNNLLDSPRSGIEGASGTLYLDDYNHIYRELQWVQVKDGQIKPL